MENERLISERLLGTAEYFGKELSKSVMALYLEALQPYADADIVGACTTAIRTLKFFPRVSDFVDIIEGDPESKAAVAWATLIKAMEDHGHYHTVAFQDGAIMSAVNAMGGWTRICEYTYEELNYRQKEFDRLYRQFSRPGQVHPDRLMGWFEADNRSKGYLTGATTPRLIGTLGESEAKKVTSDQMNRLEFFPINHDAEEMDRGDVDRGDNLQSPGKSPRVYLMPLSQDDQD